MLAGVAPERAAAVTDCSLTAPANITVSNNPNQAGAVVTYPAPTTSGTCGTITCSPVSGSFFPVGTTLVNCSANTTPVVKASFAIRVNDTQPPVITVPANKTVGNDVGRASAVVTFAFPVVSDNVPGVTVACNHVSGSLFPLGTTTVTCTARDMSANTATASFNVIVNDTEPPVIESAPDVNVTVATGAAGGVVSYPTPAAHDNSATNPGVVCAPASGSTFPVGTTSVTCSTADPSGNTATKAFSVVVTRAVPPATVVEVAPVIQAAFFSNPTFAVKRARLAAAPRGSRLGFVLTKAARVTIAIDRCNPRRRANRGCAGVRRVGTLVKDGVFGLTSTAFSGVLNGKALVPGAYRAVLTAKDSGRRSSAARTVFFTIVRR